MRRSRVASCPEVAGRFSRIGITLGHRRERIPQEAHATPLSGRAAQDRGDRLCEAVVSIRGHEAHPTEAALHQAAENRVHNARSSDGPTSMPSTWRSPSLVTPTATTVAWLVTRPLTHNGSGRHDRGRPARANARADGHRNGYRMRTWDTGVSTIELAIPKVRSGTYFPSLLQPRRRASTRSWRSCRKPTCRGSRRGRWTS